jgi:hypothetical protein
MNRTFIVAILLVAAVPVCAHTQNPKVSTGDAQKAVTIISGDKIKTQAYCDIHKLAQQLVEAHEKKDGEKVNELFEKRPAPCRVFVVIWSTRQAVCEVSFEKPEGANCKLS